MQAEKSKNSSLESLVSPQLFKVFIELVFKLALLMDSVVGLVQCEPIVLLSLVLLSFDQPLEN